MVTRTAACSPCARGSGGAGGELARARRAAGVRAGWRARWRRRRTTRGGALHHAVGAVVVALAGGDSVSAHKERGERQATTNPNSALTSRPTVRAAASAGRRTVTPRPKSTIPSSVSAGFSTRSCGNSGLTPRARVHLSFCIDVPRRRRPAAAPPRGNFEHNRLPYLERIEGFGRRASLTFSNMSSRLEHPSQLLLQIQHEPCPTNSYLTTPTASVVSTRRAPRQPAALAAAARPPPCAGSRRAPRRFRRSARACPSPPPPRAASSQYSAP